MFGFCFFLFLIADCFLLYGKKDGFYCRRTLPKRFSNGDENNIDLYLENHFNFNIKVAIIDEIPFEFQRRDILFEDNLTSFGNKKITYQLRPTHRGNYVFGKVNCFVSSPIGIIKRRFQFDETQTVGVYPSFLHLRKYELMAIANRYAEPGFKKTRKIGQSMEFEQIKHYTQGDDIRNINWKATAKRSDLMVNNYQDEKAQSVYFIIDKGRQMEMPFMGLSLLDYAINSTLILSKIAIAKQDKAGLITFSKNIDTLLLSDKKNTHLQNILEALYSQETQFEESDYEKVYLAVKRHVKQRSLLVLYANFETLNALQRQLPILRKLGHQHLLMVVFFQNSEINNFIKQDAKNIEDIYTKTIAEKYFYEKELITRELQKYGIQTLLTKPQDLIVNTINRYLDFKLRKMI